MEKIDTNRHYQEHQREAASDRLQDAATDLRESKHWPVERDGDIFYFRASTKDPRTGVIEGSKYRVAHTTCTCMASSSGKMCRHRARRHIIMTLEQEVLPFIKQYEEAEVIGVFTTSKPRQFADAEVAINELFYK